jgi:sugar phosphate isomerase/epimerase
VVDPSASPELVASFFTLSGSGFAEPPRTGFVERCHAAAEAGFAGIGLHADDLPRTVASGLDADGMRAVLAETGLRVVEIEFLGGWALGGPDLALVAGIDAVADEFGGRHVSTGEFRDGALDLDAAAARLHELAIHFGARGLRLALEAFPWSALGSPDTAVELLRRADTPHAGLLVDVWHFFNCGSRAEQLAELPSGSIAAVQLNDGPLVHDDFLRHARAERKLPGDGDLDVVGLVRALAATGFTGPWCVESNTPAFRALPAGEAAKRAAAAARAVLDEALGG